ncbi:hypothetical protein PLESTB_000578200 [Pleodorina starrii]|uniref:Uncharacterized protein n=1 Tax=Pleodorina starrii TaxID=330485 RepID=A0A9W6F0Q5_9CHLO|nr:hypothetical protein PLESTM_000306800 [Pleodorina starrii]GLC52062.1 hypothetical protein PLESTB_000578200 [Pleodorina starrii]GLC72203.1 hypothetical protein PLESTF_001218100 [Pleodorina starrii]
MASLQSRFAIGSAPQPYRVAKSTLSCATCLKHLAYRQPACGTTNGQQGLLPVLPSGRPQVQAAAFLFRREAPAKPDPESPEQVALRSSSGWQKSLSFVAFWLQLALTVVSAGVLIFSLAATNVPAGGPSWDRYFTAAGVVCGFLSTFFAHGFLRLARKLAAGEVVEPGWLSASLLRCNGLNVLGIGATVIGLQASVGTLVAKSLLASTQTPFATNPANAVVSLDVFSLQAATNSLLGHLVSLVFTNLMLRITSAATRTAAAPPPPPGGVAVGADGLSPVRPASLGYSPWMLKAD